MYTAAARVLTGIPKFSHISLILVTCERENNVQNTYYDMEPLNGRSPQYTVY